MVIARSWGEGGMGIYCVIQFQFYKMKSSCRRMVLMVAQQCEYA